MNDDEKVIAEKILAILDDTDYHDLEGAVYSEIKFLKVKMMRNESIEAQLQDLLYVLNEKERYVDVDGGCELARALLEEYFKK